MKYTIEDVRKSACAIINDGTPDEFETVLKLVDIKRYHPVYKTTGVKYFWVSDTYRSGFVNNDFVSLPVQSVKDFLKPEFVWGEEIEAKLVKGANFGTMQYYYVSTNPLKNADNKYIVVSKLGNVLSVFDVRKIEVKDVELTMQEIADKFKIDVTRLKVKQ